MNTEILDILCGKYESKMPILYGEQHGELFKWRALKTFQQEWFTPADKYQDFISRFNAATRDFSIFIDNSRMHPRNGVVKLYEKEPAEVQRLFVDVLFAEDHGDIDLRQEHMEQFLAGMEQLRIKYYPANWSFKQDRHSASTYLAMFAPTENYVYKHSEAKAMAQYGEFGLEIGSGASFSLKRYYQMCDEIAAHLKTCDSLLGQHFSSLEECHYQEESLHLLTFDLIYCCRTYAYYNNIPFYPKKKATKKQAKQKSVKDVDPEKLAKKEVLQHQITELELQLPDVTEIALVDTEVQFQSLGTGTIVEQNLNTIKVRFKTTEKSFILDKKYTLRPHFENDEEVVQIFTEYNAAVAKVNALKMQLKTL